MSDTFISLVPEKIGNRKEEIHKKFISFLLDRNIINNDLKPGDNVDSILVENNGNFKRLTHNQLEVTNSRQVFDSGANEIKQIVCPNCNQNILDQINWMEAIDYWYSDSQKKKVDCPNCSYVNSIENYIFNPTWGFGELGFIFWNWPEFEDNFIKEISELTSSKFKIIHGKI